MFIKLDEKQLKILRKKAIQFQDDIVCSVDTDFIKSIAIAQNELLFDIIKLIQEQNQKNLNIVEIPCTCQKCKYSKLLVDNENINHIYRHCRMINCFVKDDGFCPDGEEA